MLARVRSLAITGDLTVPRQWHASCSFRIPPAISWPIGRLAHSHAEDPEISLRRRKQEGRMFNGPRFVHCDSQGEMLVSDDAAVDELRFCSALHWTIQPWFDVLAGREKQAP